MKSLEMVWFQDSGIRLIFGLQKIPKPIPMKIPGICLFSIVQGIRCRDLQLKPCQWPLSFGIHDLRNGPRACAYFLKMSFVMIFTPWKAYIFADSFC